MFHIHVGKFYILSTICNLLINRIYPWNKPSPWNSPGQNTGVGSLSLLQQVFPTQGSNPGLPNSRWIPYQLNHKGSLTNRIIESKLIHLGHGQLLQFGLGLVLVWFGKS